MLKPSREQTLLNEIFKVIQRGKPETVVPVGDDGFVYQSFSNKTVIVQDMSIEGTHFRRDWSTPHDIGWKSLAVNFSDLAAMGASPRFVQVSLGVPLDVADEEVIEFYKGMTALADKYGAEIVGGDLCASPGPWIIDVSCVGETESPIGRHGARVGDELFVTGSLGLAALGLKQLRELGTSERAISKHLRPNPRLDFLPVLRPDFCRSAIDVSDGLVNELGILCRHSHLGFTLEAEKIPLHQERRYESFDQALQNALWGGEDYELLLVVGSDQREKFIQKVDSLGLKVFSLGYFDSTNEIILTDATGKKTPLTTLEGWQHF